MVPCQSLCHQRQVWVKLQLALHLLLLLTLQLCRLPPPLPPPIRNSSCLVTWYQPLYASCCIGLLYFSRLCAAAAIAAKSLQACPDSVRPHRQQPTRLCHPWDSLGKNPGVGCHFLLQCMKVKREIEVAQSCLTLRDPMDCSLPGSSVHGIFQARVLEWVAIAFSCKALYCKIKNILFFVFVFYVLFVWKVL